MSWKIINAKSRRRPQKAVITVSKAKYARVSTSLSKALKAKEGERIELAYYDLNTFAVRVHDGPNTYKLGVYKTKIKTDEPTLIFSSEKLKERVKLGDYELSDEVIMIDDQPFKVLKRVDQSLVDKAHVKYDGALQIGFID